MLHHKIRDGFGRYYRLHTYRDGITPTGLKPKRLNDPLFVKQFIRTLRASDSYWRYLISSIGSDARYGNTPHTSVEHHVCKLMIVGKIKVFDITDFQAVLSNMDKHTFKGAGSKRVQLLPASAQLVVDKQALKSLGSRKQAHQYLEKLGADEEQLKSIVQGLPPAAKPVGNASTLDTVVQSLIDGNLVVAETETNSVRSKESAEKSGSEAEAASGADTQPISHGPHQEGIVGTKASNDEQVKEEPVCELTKFSVRCDHLSTRGYLLDAIAGEPNLNSVHKGIQVISREDEPDHIKMSFAGSCAHGKPGCPSITVDGDTLSETTVASPHKFPVVPPIPTREVNSFTDFLRHYLVPDLGSMDFQTYTLSASGCADIQPCEAKVHAFPTFKWSGEVTMGYNESSKGISEWKLGAKLHGNISNKTWKLETGNGQEADSYFPEIRGTLKGLVDRLTEIVQNGKDKNKLVKSKITWPSVALGGNVELQEVDNSHSVGLGGEISLSMAPLLKADVRTDLLDWLILASGPYGTFLKEIKAKAAEGVGSDDLNAKAILAIELVVEGGLEAQLKWKKQAANRWVSVDGDKTGQASVSLTVGLEAKIKVETKVFYVKITLGAELHVKGASNTSEGIGGIVTLYATTAENKPAVGGEIKFTGAAIYYTYYAEVNVNNVNTEKKGRGSRGGLFKSKGNTDTKVNEQTMKKLAEILPAATWPKNPGRTPIDALNP